MTATKGYILSYRMLCLNNSIGISKNSTNNFLVGNNILHLDLYFSRMLRMFFRKKLRLRCRFSYFNCLSKGDSNRIYLYKLIKTSNTIARIRRKKRRFYYSHLKVLRSAFHIFIIMTYYSSKAHLQIQSKRSILKTNDLRKKQLVEKTINGFTNKKSSRETLLINSIFYKISNNNKLQNENIKNKSHLKKTNSKDQHNTFLDLKKSSPTLIKK